MALINTINGEVDESKLIKREGEIDNDNEHTQRQSEFAGVTGDRATE